MMKQINLKAILENHIDENAFNGDYPNNDYDNVLLAMKEACEQVLDIAAEESTVNMFDSCEKLCFNSMCQSHKMCMSTSPKVNKNSILKIKERL
jgi:hypothetical protein